MIKNIVFSSGSIYGICYLGCLKILEENNLLDNFENIIGCSVGSMFSLCVCLGYKYNELLQIFKKVDINIFNDIEYDNIINFTKTYGFQKGDRIINVLKILIKAKMDTSDITFKDLYEKTKKNLIVCTTCLSTSTTDYFSYETTPDMNVIETIKMSIAIPFLFEPILYENKYYVDGALLNSYPIDYFKNKNETLGVLIDHDFENIINNIEDYCLSVLFCSLKNVKKNMFENYKENTILIDCKNDYDSIDFSITDEKKMCLIEDGIKCTRQFIDNENFKNIFFKDTHSLDTDALETHALETDALETHALETDSLETDALETHALETDSLETHALETNALETNALETHTLETHTLETQ